MNNDPSFQDAKRLYLEQYGDPMVTNTYLKIALTLVSLIAVGLLVLDLKTIRTFEDFRPLVIRIDDLGPGVDLSAIPNPNLPENLLKPSGRGVYFMRAVMDKVELEHRVDGTTLVLVKYRKGHEEATA